MAFQKFMNKKDFHPGSLRNIKMVWEAEQKEAAAEKREKEMKELYEKEQERYRTRQYVVDSDESAKLSLNFMYEAPPGMKREDKEEEEPKLELKFDWQKQIPEGKQAPRESYAKDLDIKDKPFGIEVRNVHCIKCGKWGHINTDKICPLFGKSKEDLFVPTEDPSLLMREMRKDGLAIKRNAMGRQVDPHANNQRMIASSDEDDDPEIAFLKSLSGKDKMKLLKKLDKQEREQEDEKQAKHHKKKPVKKEKLKKHKKNKRKRRHKDSESSESSGIDSSIPHRQRHDSEDEQETAAQSRNEKLASRFEEKKRLIQERQICAESQKSRSRSPVVHRRSQPRSALSERRKPVRWRKSQSRSPVKQQRSRSRSPVRWGRNRSRSPVRQRRHSRE